MDSLADALAGTAGTIVGKDCDLSPRLFESKSSSVRRWNYRGTNTSGSLSKIWIPRVLSRSWAESNEEFHPEIKYVFFCNDFWVELIDDYICKAYPKVFRCMRVHTL